MITTIDPQMENRGAKLRILKMIDKKRINTVIVLCFKRKGDISLGNDITVKYCHMKLIDYFLIFFAIFFRFKPITNAFFIRSELSNLLRSDDYILTHLVRCLVFPLNKYKRMEVDVCESLSKNYFIRANLRSWFDLRKYIYLYDGMRMRHLENMVKNHKVYLISESDPLVEIMSNYEIVSNFDNRVVNQIDLNVSRRILFIGHIDYEPNLECVMQVCEELKYSEYEFVICGTISSKNAKRLKDYKNVVLLGYVDNLDTLGKDFVCGIAYLKSSTGTQNKVFDYLSLGMPVIGSQNLEGLSALEEFITRVDSLSGFEEMLDTISQRSWRSEYNDCVDRFRKGS
jgi:hypothetical protein